MRNFLFTVLVLFVTTAQAQTKITWKTLADVTFIDKWSKKEEAYYYFPKFGESVIALDGKEVQIKGYFLPINPEEGLFILSRNSFAMCFFCGAAGPETIISLFDFDNKLKLKMDDIVTLKGRLRLNADDIYECNYILEDIKIVWE